MKISKHVVFKDCGTSGLRALVLTLTPSHFLAMLPLFGYSKFWEVPKIFYLWIVTTSQFRTPNLLPKGSLISWSSLQWGGGIYPPWTLNLQNYHYIDNFINSDHPLKTSVPPFNWFFLMKAMLSNVVAIPYYRAMTSMQCLKGNVFPRLVMWQLTLITI